MAVNDCRPMAWGGNDGGVFGSGSESSGHIENCVDGGHVFDVVFGHIVLVLQFIGPEYNLEPIDGTWVSRK